MNRLRAYRDIEGLSQQQLAQILDISPQLVSAIESGRRPFLGSLDPLGYSEHRFQLPEMSEPLHRQRSSTAVASRKKAKELLRLAGEVFTELTTATARAPRWRVERRSDITGRDQIDSYATDVRIMLGHEEAGPIQNLTVAVERAGICLVPIDLAGIDGISAWIGDTPVIGASPRVPGDRFRFSIGHELGHLLMHARSGDGVEREAHQFAGALLFPPDEFESALPDRPTLRDFVSLKSSWGISAASLVYMAHDRDYIDDARYRALQIQMSRWRKSEPATFDPAYGTLLGRLIDVNGGIEAVAARLGVCRDHLSMLLAWRHLRAV